MRKVNFFVIVFFAFSSICGVTPRKNIAPVIIHQQAVQQAPVPAPDFQEMLNELKQRIDSEEDLSESRYDQYLQNANDENFIIALDYLFNHHFIFGYVFIGDWLSDHFDKLVNISWEKAFYCWKIHFNNIQNEHNILAMNSNSDFSPIDAVLTFADMLLKKSSKEGFIEPSGEPIKELCDKLSDLILKYSYFEYNYDFITFIINNSSVHMNNADSHEMLADSFIALFYRRFNLSTSFLQAKLQKIWQESSEHFKKSVRRCLKELNDWEPAFITTYHMKK